MDTYKTIVTKRDSRSFTDEAIPEETVRRIVQAGRMAGSSKNVQPCRFVIIDDPEEKAAIAKCGDFAAWIPTAPLIVAIALTDAGTRNEFDAGRAAQSGVRVVDNLHRHASIRLNFGAMALLAL